jgi:hypothetical protein
MFFSDSNHALGCKTTIGRKYPSSKVSPSSSRVKELNLRIISDDHHDSLDD